MTETENVTAQTGEAPLPEAGSPVPEGASPVPAEPVPAEDEGTWRETPAWEEPGPAPLPVYTAEEGAASIVSERRRLVDENARRAAEEQIRRISKWDPGIGSVSDLMAQPNYPEIRERVYGHGDTLDEAYEWVNREQIARARAARAARQAQDSVASKAHLTAQAAAAGASREVSVPPDVARMYRAANPGMGKKEMQEKYRRFLSYQRD